MPYYGLVASGFALLVALAFLYRSFASWYRLRHVPGPFFASISNLQRVWWVKTGRAHLHHQAMHRRYGPVVRTGPNMVSFSNPADIPTVYPIRTGLPKSDFYAALRPYSPNGGALPGVFNAQDETLLKTLKHPLVPIFAPANVMRYEGFIDEMLGALAAQLDAKFAREGKVCDVGEWLMYFTFDVMGLMTFSKTYGFVASGTDIGGLYNTIFAYFKAASAWTQIPWLDAWVNKTGFLQRFRKTPGMAILGVTAKIIQERLVLEEKEGGPKEDRGDMLAHYLDVQRSSPSVPTWAPHAWVFSNVVAGSDSVGTVMQTLLHNLLKHPSSLSHLASELRAAQLSSPYPTYTSLRDLPYLDACISEASRLHPPFCLPLERVAPADGIIVSGVYIPGGTCIGGNAYVVNRSSEIFGADVESWRPERWLSDGEGGGKRKMAAGMLTFGAGRRVCMGKPIAMMEMKKLTAFLVLNFEMEIANEDLYTVENAWFLRNKGIYAKIQRRSK